MDKQVHELTWELKRLQLVVDRAIEAVRPLPQASDTMLRDRNLPHQGVRQ